MLKTKVLHHIKVVRDFFDILDSLSKDAVNKIWMNPRRYFLGFVLLYREIPFVRVCICLSNKKVRFIYSRGFLVIKKFISERSIDRYNQIVYYLPMAQIHEVL